MIDLIPHTLQNSNALGVPLSPSITLSEHWLVEDLEN
jgi:hypothetical protein